VTASPSLPLTPIPSGVKMTATSPVETVPSPRWNAPCLPR
jgi:hypothetical protein